MFTKLANGVAVTGKFIITININIVTFNNINMCVGGAL